MPLFLITFIVIYGSMHAYVFIRLRGAFSPHQPTVYFLAALLGLLTIAPLFVRLAEGYGFEQTARWIAWPAFVWMGSVLILCSCMAALDLTRGFARISNHFWGTSVPALLSVPITVELALIVTFIASGYALYEARQIRSEHVTVITTKLPPQIDRLRIVQISDIHLGLLFRESRLESVLKAVRDAHPDVLVSTGDLVDGRLSREDVISHMNRLAAMIAAVPTGAGKFAVTGNHEFYAGISPAVELTRTAGFTVLRNQSYLLPQGITISGIDDPAEKRKKSTSASPAELELLKSFPTGKFHVLLRHRPVVPVSSDGRFDLQLSGHVHKGQIFPFNLLVRLKFAIPCGTSTTAAGSLIHVSRGSGTWGPPMRLFAPPEVTIIDIVSDKVPEQNK